MHVDELAYGCRGDGGQGMQMCCMQMSWPADAGGDVDRVCRCVACRWVYLWCADMLHVDGLTCGMWIGCVQIGCVCRWVYLWCEDMLHADGLTCSVQMGLLALACRCRWW